MTEEEHTVEQEIVFHATGRKPYSLRLKPSIKENSIIPLSLIDRLVPSLDRIASDAWRNAATGEIFSLEDVVERFSDRLPAGITGERTKMPEWLVDMRKSVPIRLIETQRLLSSTKISKRSEYDRTITPEYAVTEDLDISLK